MLRDAGPQYQHPDVRGTMIGLFETKERSSCPN
jgi:hypothetical protein